MSSLYALLTNGHVNVQISRTLNEMLTKYFFTCTIVRCRIIVCHTNVVVTVFLPTLNTDLLTYFLTY